MSKGGFDDLQKKKGATSAADFIEGAAVDGSGDLHDLDPKAARNYKSIRLGFNEYEYKLLERAAADANLSLVAYVRSTWMAKAKRGT